MDVEICSWEIGVVRSGRSGCKSVTGKTTPW